MKIELDGKLYVLEVPHCRKTICALLVEGSHVESWDSSYTDPPLNSLREMCMKHLNKHIADGSSRVRDVKVECELTIEESTENNRVTCWLWVEGVHATYWRSDETGLPLSKLHVLCKQHLDEYLEEKARVKTPVRDRLEDLHFQRSDTPGDAVFLYSGKKALCMWSVRFEEVGEEPTCGAEHACRDELRSWRRELDQQEVSDDE